MQTVKRFQVLLFNTNYSIQHYSFIYTQSNGRIYYYVIPIIWFRHTVKEFQELLFNANNSIEHYSFVCTVKWFKVFLYIPNNSIKHHSFVYTLLSVKTVSFLPIYSKLSHLFVLYFDLRPGPKILLQGNTPEGSYTFQRPVIERDRMGGLRLMIWGKVKVPLCHYSHAPEESNLWTAWQLFPLDHD